MLLDTQPPPDGVLKRFPAALMVHGVELAPLSTEPFFVPWRPIPVWRSPIVVRTPALRHEAHGRGEGPKQLDGVP
ncbi:MAG: hypothetical protein AB2556_23505 [Candidatus Thiodiazotropha sp.]